MRTFLGLPTDNESLRAYQRDRWGSLDGETCVIELSGLASPNMKEAKDTSLFLQARIQLIRRKIYEYKPKLVVMYGRKQKRFWEQVAENQFPPEPGPFFCKGPTLLAITPHPTRPIKIKIDEKYVVNEYWTGLGRKLRDQHCKSV
jgi:hypothetical protein